MPVTVVLSMWMGVGGCGCPSLSSMRRITFASFALWKSAPSSASAADAATVRKTVQSDKIGPFKNIGLLSIGCLPKKKWPPIRLLALGAVR